MFTNIDLKKFNDYNVELTIQGAEWKTDGRVLVHCPCPSCTEILDTVPEY